MFEWVHAIQMAARYNHLSAALSAFHEVEAAGRVAALPACAFNTLLFVACGGDLWEQYTRRQPIAPATHTDKSVSSPPFTLHVLASLKCCYYH